MPQTRVHLWIVARCLPKKSPGADCRHGAIALKFTINFNASLTVDKGGPVITTHEFLFGAVAELIDNSRDAGATELDIYTSKRQDASLRGGFMLYFVDNGCGMSPEEARNVIIFGKSLKRSVDGSSIGMYGNGLKSGSMRVGSDMILFTRREGVYTCLFLSRTFHEEEKLDEVIVPLPTFKAIDKTPLSSSPEELKKHELEMQIILKYSPFRCNKDFFSQFDKIKGETGTLVIIYNMKLLDNGSPELDINTDPRDILLMASSDKDDPMEPHADIELPPEKRSLRAYVSILYADPRMKVYIQGRKVQTKRLLDILYAARRYNFASKTFRMRAERDLAKAKNDVKIAELRAREAESKARDCELRYEGSKDPEHLKLVRRLNNAAAELRNLVTLRQNTVARKQKALKEPKTLTFYFGMNVVNRACDGMFIYNCSRLIKMYQRIGPQQDSSMMCRGVVGIVDVPYMVLEPTHNKQDFADAKEFRQLMRAMADHLMQYWDDLAIDKNGSEDINRFWKSFGYLSARWRDPPSNEEKYARKRYSCVSICVQCDKCLRWRVLPYSQNQIGRDVPDNWQCRDNPDQKHRRCDAPEEDMNPPLGVLKRKIKTKEQRQAELEAQIRKKQEELEQILDPDDEIVAIPKSGDLGSGTGRGSARGATSAVSAAGKRAAPKAPSPPPPPTKRTASASTRALTVADKKRMSSTGAPSRSSSDLPMPTSVSKPRSGGLTPKFNNAQVTAKSRRVVRQESTSSSSSSSETEASEEEEDEEQSAQDEHNNLVDKSKSRSAATATKTQPKISTVTSSASEASSSSSGVKNSSSAAVAASSASKSSALDEVTSSGQISNTAPSTTANNDLTATAPRLPNGSEDTKQMALVESSTTPSAGRTYNPELVEKILEKFKLITKVLILDSKPSRVVEKLPEAHAFLKWVCLRYFLPPQWPMQKDHIHTLSEAELADFPLEDFFDRYEQGLRALLANFQQETQSCSDTLQNVRKDVAALLDKVAPHLKASSLEGEAIDQLLQEHLHKIG
ncbi:unnamed protein product [Schistocephalus solidus]|uniref:CW-type domain-containing protein n=1 Tax=Schistocephalus solidus TaxID=70667 RepID=A0A3P7CPT9_SCHSO|nr:unnamed protein product [Schistocephalus solidus]